MFTPVIFLTLHASRKVYTPTRHCAVNTVTHHLMSCRNLLGLPERRPIIPEGQEKESGIPCIDPGGGGWFGRVAAQSPFAKGTSNEFSEASRRTIKELGNIELNDLGEISQTV